MKMQGFPGDSEKSMGAHRRIIAARAQPVESDRRLCLPVSDEHRRKYEKTGRYSKKRRC